MEKGFFASLFDISFSSLVATKVIKVIYVLSMVLIGLTSLVIVAGAFSNSVGAGLFTLIVLAPLAALAVPDLRAGDPRGDHLRVPDHGDQRGARVAAARGDRPGHAAAVGSAAGPDRSRAARAAAVGSAAASRLTLDRNERGADDRCVGAQAGGEERQVARLGVVDRAA